jgi:hypothetical protein
MFRKARLPSILFLIVLLFGCGPDSRKPFVGTWRLDADYFKEQLEKQDFKVDEAKAALDQSIPLWQSYKVEFTFGPDGRYQMSTQLHDSKVASVQGSYEVPAAATPTLTLSPKGESKPTHFAYRFVDADTLELDSDLAPPGYPKTSRYKRAKAEEVNRSTEKKAAP